MPATSKNQISHVKELRGFSPEGGRNQGSESVHQKSKEGVAVLGLMKQESSDVKLTMPLDEGSIDSYEELFVPNAKRSVDISLEENKYEMMEVIELKSSTSTRTPRHNSMQESRSN